MACLSIFLANRYSWRVNSSKPFSSISDNVNREIVKCPACGCSDIKLIFDFGKVPLAGYFPERGSSDRKYLIPMQLRICSDCQLVQVNPDVNDEILFEDYRYVSSVGMQKHFDEFAHWFTESRKITKSSRILEIGCNDGPLLKSLTNHGYQPVGIDPARNIVERAKEKGLNVICDYFNLNSVIHNELESSFDVVISCNSFAHISNIDEIAESVAKTLTQDGIFIVEVQSLQDLVETRAYDFVYHEHKYYYSLFSLSALMKRHGMFLIDALHINTHGGSIRYVFSKKELLQTQELTELIHKERSIDLSVHAIADSIQFFMHELNKLKHFLQEAVRRGEICVGIGASGRANMILNYLQLGPEILSEVFDESSERINREMALSGIPISPFSTAPASLADNVVVLAWNFSDILIEKWPIKNSKFILPLPIFTII